MSDQSHAEHDRETLAVLEAAFEATGADLIEAILRPRTSVLAKALAAEVFQVFGPYGVGMMATQLEAIAGGAQEKTNEGIGGLHLRKLIIRDESTGAWKITALGRQVLDVAGVDT